MADFGLTDPRTAANRRSTAMPRAVVALLGSIGFLSTFNAVRVGPIGGPGDVVLLIALLLTFVMLASQASFVVVRPYRAVVAMAALIATLGAVGEVINSTEGWSGPLELVRFVASTAGLALVFAAVMPNYVEVRWLTQVYVAGATTNCIVALTTDQSFRVAGLSGHANLLGLSSALALGALLGEWSSSPRPISRFASIARSGVLVVLLLGINQSGSRGALVAAIVIVAAFVALSGSPKVIGLAILGAATALLVFVIGLPLPGGSALQRTFSPDETSVESNVARLELVRSVVRRVGDSGGIGSGFGRATEAHNVYLQIVDISGPLGLVAFGGFVWFVLSTASRNRRDPLCRGLLAAFIGYLVAGLVGNTLWDRWLWFPVLLLLASTLVARSSGAKSPSSVSRDVPSARAMAAPDR